jgi:hypothetical protein
VKKVNNITAETLIRVLKNIFGRLEIPQILVSDNGTQYAEFLSEEFAKCGIFNMLHLALNIRNRTEWSKGPFKLL